MKVYEIAIVVIFLLSPLSTCVSNVTTLTFENFDKFVDKMNNVVLVRFCVKWYEMCKNMQLEYEKVANYFDGCPNVFVTDVDVKDSVELALRFGVSKNYPIIMLFLKGRDPIVYGGGLNSSEIIAFAEGWMLGTSEKFYDDWTNSRQEPIELEPSAIEKITKELNRDLFLYFYERAFDSYDDFDCIWNRLCSVYANEKSVVIAKMDTWAHAEFISQYAVEDFPRVVFFPKMITNEKPEAYLGPKSLEGLVGYVNTRINTFRAIDGGYLPTFGVYESLINIVKAFCEGRISSEEALIQLTDEINELGSAISQDVSIIYHNIIFALEKDSNYFPNEINRLSGILNSLKISSAKFDALQIRLNIINAILNNSTGSPPLSAIENDQSCRSDNHYVCRVQLK